MKKTFIGATGYGYSGSGAVIDLLKEFENVEVVDGMEFQILYFPDGIKDLEIKLTQSFNRFYDSDIAIVRFLELAKKLDREYGNKFKRNLFQLCESYVSKITALKWHSFWAYDRLSVADNRLQNAIGRNKRIDSWNGMIRKINRLPKINIPYLKYIDYGDLYEKRDMYLSINPSNFEEETKRFVVDLCDLAIKTNSNFVAFDQFVPPNNPKQFFKYFDNLKVVVVDRDPRDVYLFSKIKKVSFIPHDNVKDFIIWYRENLKKEAITLDDDVLRIHFEDLIYEYDKTVSLIKKYIGLGEQLKPKQLFNPDVSINNTQLFNKYVELKSDVKEIENELPEFLYDFDSHFSYVSNGNIF